MSLAHAGYDRRPLGDFLQSRRGRLNPAECGFPAGRRRTPGLRREEVAQLAGVSVTWYTWLEQGREIQVSTQTLEGIARALRLDRAEREHLFLLAQGRPPAMAEWRPREITAALQRMLDGLTYSPAYIRTKRWDIVGWNRAVAMTFADYGAMEPHERNSIRLVFAHPAWRTLMVDWEADAKKALAVFRADFARAGNDPRFLELVDELDRLSPEFHQWWPRHDVRNHGEGVKAVRHPKVGLMSLEYTAFIVESDPDLRMVVYTPAPGSDTAGKIARLVDGG
ncbi:XRE family transcriptional regulator [Rhodomicrobium udaipurense JA643]|uniref:Helix-turn-helix domain-containing protein n=1 Tax=Rhodomicrobium udaipurense TaxID=1202716 RepID=A0A8I1GF65_9HYPH|nr:helix-turn-helix transcriptional regulator [Rhodomicrobium udaipurense]KAI94951.1 XRE family transcriptional regulator [Rhodomicrobium udaipurense JA643]MBJ7542601.1 helix-turn-helix domain-containing protein [Rhodomicrobium udaipurense]